MGNVKVYQNQYFFCDIGSITFKGLSIDHNGVGKRNFIKDKDSLNSKVNYYVRKYVDLEIFSGTVLIAENGKPVYYKAFGLADREKKRPNSVKTKFLIGSMNKNFTRVIILQLIQEGKLTWNDKLVKYIDGFKQKDASEITIRQLVEHSSGVGDYETMDFVKRPQEQQNTEAILNIARKVQLDFLPGSEHKYSNTGYVILGAIIEKITGKSYLENIKERIIDPLGMKNTYITNTKSRKDRAIGYIQTINGFGNTDWVIPDPPRADGGFWCTAEDLLRFYQNYYYGNFLLSDSIKNTDNYFNQIAPGYNRNMFAIDQAGGTNGHNSSLIQILKENISIIVLANMDEPVAEKIACGIEQIIRGNEPESPKLPAILNAYKIYKEKGLTYLKDNFKNVISSLPLQDSKDVVLNNLGYQLLEIHKINEALEIFRLNTELFPDIGNVWDSYGEALLKKGDKKEALIAYKKALEINPELESSKSAIKKLK